MKYNKKIEMKNIKKLDICNKRSNIQLVSKFIEHCKFTKAVELQLEKNNFKKDSKFDTVLIRFFDGNFNIILYLSNTSLDHITIDCDDCKTDEFISFFENVVEDLDNILKI